MNATAPRPLTPLRILIVDDFRDARELLSDYLTLAGYAVLEATNGEEGVARAIAEAPALILMDLNMPVMDGWEATRRLRLDPRTRAIPIIALSGQSSLGDAGAERPACDSFLVRPCRPAAVVAEVQRLLARDRAQA